MCNNSVADNYCHTDDGTIVSELIDYDLAGTDPLETIVGGEWTLDLSDVVNGYTGASVLQVGYYVQIQGYPSTAVAKQF